MCWYELRCGLKRSPSVGRQPILVKICSGLKGLTQICSIASIRPARSSWSPVAYALVRKRAILFCDRQTRRVKRKRAVTQNHCCGRCYEPANRIVLRRYRHRRGDGLLIMPGFLQGKENRYL